MEESCERTMLVGVNFVDATTGALRVLPLSQYQSEIGSAECEEDSPASAAKLQQARDFPPPFRPRRYGCNEPEWYMY
jgi:hypothetical protein